MTMAITVIIQKNPAQPGNVFWQMCLERLHLKVCRKMNLTSFPATNLILNRRKQPLHRLCNIWRAATVMPLEPNMMMQWHIRLLLYVFPWHKMPIRNILQQRSQRTFPRNRLPISANTLQNCRGLKYQRIPYESTTIVNIFLPLSVTPEKYPPTNTINFQRQMIPIL